MAYNVISGRKVAKNTHIFKIIDNLGSRPQKSLNRSLLNSLIGMALLRWYLGIAHVQTIQNMYGKGG